MDWTTLGAIAAVLAVPIAILVGWLTVRAQGHIDGQLDYEIVSNTGLMVDQALGRLGTVKIIYDGRSLEDPFSLIIRIVNTGRKDISAGEFLEERYTIGLSRKVEVAVLMRKSNERKAIELVNRQFKQYITQGGGWRLLWNDDGSEKDEEAAQLLYKGIVQYYCHANNIVVDREVELGRGPVDFKFSNGYENRALLEVKKLHNGKFWQGIQRQLPSYLSSDDCKDGWFVAIRYRDGEHWDERWRDLPEIARQIADEHGLRLRVDRIDARRPPSASKL